MEKEYKISWLKVMGVILAFVVVIAIICFLLPKNKGNDSSVLTTYSKNIMVMKEAGFEYFQGSNLPDKVGSSNSISLGEMFDSKLIVEFLDEKGKSCNINESYIKVTKTLDKEYAMKVQLNCDNKSDYIVTSIAEQFSNNSSNNYDNNVGNNNSSNNNIANNDNFSGGSNSSNNNGSIGYVRPGNIQQITNININYVNSCNACTGSNCNSNCLNNVYYTVTYDTQGGSYVARRLVREGDYASYAMTYRPGYKFLGWYLNGEMYEFNTPVRHPITLVAKWEKVEDTNPDDPKNKYQVNFDSNGGSYVGPQDIIEGDTAKRPTDPTKKCYEFLGWYLNGVKYDFNKPVSGNITLVARWVDDGTCRSDYNVRYDSNGGSYVESERVPEGELATRPKDPTKKCYRFDGWYTNSSLTKEYNFNTPVRSDMILYAKWIDDGSCVKEHNIIFDSNGGSYVRNQTVKDGDRAYEPSDPTRNGYRFLGWYYNGSIFNFNRNIYNDYTLVARWEREEEKEHVVTFDSNGGSYVRSQTVKDGNRAYEPSDPTRNGYRFLGWYYNGSTFNFNRSIYSDYTLVARWEKVEIKYNTYCKVQSKRYYSTSYVGGATSKNWRIKFDNLFNVQDLKINNIGYITSTQMYNDVYYNYINGKGISTDTTSSKYEVPITSGWMLEQHSLKSSNFTKSLSSPYYSGGYWYTNASIYIRNYNNVTPYNASGIGKIYMVPFYFDVSYTDMNNCIDDYASNASRYSGYKVVASYYR